MRKILLSCLVLFALGESRVVRKCELAKALLHNGIPKEQLGDWLCLTDFESRFDTQAIHVNSGGSSDHGIFQINDKYWCSNADPDSKPCKVKCSDLMIDDLKPSIDCAKIIFGVHKFYAWHGWTSHCQEIDKSPYLAGCRI